MDRVRPLLFSSQPAECDSCLIIADSYRKRLDRVVGENMDIQQVIFRARPVLAVTHYFA
jgi:hypothetical protein